MLNDILVMIFGLASPDIGYFVGYILIFYSIPYCIVYAFFLCKCYGAVLVLSAPFTIIPYPFIRYDIYTLRALSYARLGNFQAALAQVNVSFARGDKNPVRTYVNRAYFYLGLKEYVAALEDCEQAIKCKPNLMLAYHNRGCAHYGLKNYAQACSDFERAFQLRPTYMNNSMMLSMAYAACGDYSRAVQALNKGIKRSPYEARYYSQLAFIYFLSHDYQYAIECGQRASTMRTSSDVICRAYNNLGCAYLALRDLSQAQIYFDKALRRNPKHHILLFSLFEVNVMLHFDNLDYPSLRRQLEVIVANVPDTEIYRNLYDGVLAYFQGDYAQSCNVLARAVEDEALSVAAHVWFCIACAAYRQDELALLALEHALKLEHRDSVMLLPLHLIATDNPAFYAAHIQFIVEAIPPLTEAVSLPA